MKIYIASQNPGKLKEFQSILSSYQVHDLSDFPGLDIVEDQDSFEGNALKKALAVSQLVEDRVIADDSGLAVDALNLAPGVFSARYAGVLPPNHDDANCEKLLLEMSAVPLEFRTARYVCVIAYIDCEKKQHLFKGEMEGWIGFERFGTGGFGYDSLFYPEGFRTQTLAEMDLEFKNQISHRKKAVDLFLNHLGKHG